MHFADGKQIEEISKTLAELRTNLENSIKQSNDVLIFEATWVGLLNNALNKIEADMVNFKHFSVQTKTKASLHSGSLQSQVQMLKTVREAIYKIRLCHTLIRLLKNRNGGELLLKDEFRIGTDDLNVSKLKFLRKELLNSQ